MKQPKSRSFAFQMSLVFSAVFVCFTALVFVVGSLNTYAMGQRLQGNSLGQGAYHVSNQIRLSLKDMETELLALARTVNDINLYDKEGLYQAIVEESRDLQYLLRVKILDSGHNVMVDYLKTDKPTAPPSVSPPSWKSPMEGVFIPFLQVDSPKPAEEAPLFIDLSRPELKGSSGSTHQQCFMVVLFDWNWADPVIAGFLSPLRNEMSVDTFILRFPDGKVLNGPRELRGKSISLESFPNLKDHSWGWVDGKIGMVNKPALTGYASTGLHPGLSNLGLVILLSQSDALSWRPIKDSIVLALIGTMFFVCVFILLIFTMSRRLSRPLSLLAEEVRSYTHDVDKEVPLITGIKEVEDVCIAFREMIHNLQLTTKAHQEAEKAATHDTLTGLPNRLALQEYLHDSMLWDESGMFRVFMFLDLDGFKDINDNYGHEAGDEVLKVIAHRIQGATRGESLTVRLGGDEFLVIMNLSLRELVEKIDRSISLDPPAWLKHIKNQVRPVASRILNTCSLGIPWEGTSRSHLLMVHSSIGGAIWPLDHPDPSVILQYADKAMYESKRAGKNRFTWHSPGEDSGH